MTEVSGPNLTSVSGKPLPKTIGGYKVIGRLSRGGMGEVLLGQKESHGFTKKVAIKVVLPHVADQEDYRTLFFDEAKLVARMSHPNLTQVFDFGEDEGGLFLVMELIEGISVEKLFRAHVEEGRHMPAELAGLVVAQAARGLHSAHSLRGDDGELLGVVHRDVSPQNLIVTWSGSTKVLDFGIARSKVRKGQTQIGIVRGKPGYMAPEQALNQPLDARTDIFQLGIVLYELLTSEELYVQDNMYAAIAAAVEKPVPRLVGKVDGIDPGYQDVLDMALAKAPDERFSSADALARALDNVIARSGRPVTEAALGDYVRSLRSPTSTAPEAQQTRKMQGRAEGQSTVALESGEHKKTTPGRPHAMGTAPLPSLAPGETTEDIEPSAAAPLPAVKTVSAQAVGPAGVETGAIAFQRSLRRQRKLALGFLLLFVLGGGGLAWWALQSAEPDPVVDATRTDPMPPDEPAPEPAPAVVDENAGDSDESEEAEKVAEAPPVEKRDDRGRRRRRRRTTPKAAPEPAAPTGEPAPEARPAPEPPPPEKEEPEEVRYGELKVISKPWAVLVVDGKRLGNTPTTVKVPVGKHRVRLLDPSNETPWSDEVVTVSEAKLVELRRFKNR